MSNDSPDTQELLRRLRALPAEEREPFLLRECGDDQERLNRLRQLLEEDASQREDATLAGPPTPVDGLDATVAPETESISVSTTQAGPGLVIAGRYTLQKKIGEGGMGDVWIAKQSTPVKRNVALKLIKKGLDSEAVLARFDLERQALALMDHPNIAKVLDGGLTPTGQPFFVMELVKGLPLDRFCDEGKLSLEERLQLFVPICHAVQHAHQKGIVHRDLKPANILVTTFDGHPVPKVIDFGVAKATSGKLTSETMTQFGAVVGTLEYMSPEQAGLSGEDIDTRTDVYSLGVILYELLTGLRPIDAERLHRAAVTEMIRIIREEEPSKPSTRLSTNEALPMVAAVRRTEPQRLMALLRGELDWVVMKCLEKDRERRYETAASLVRDIQHYLTDEPVEARPPSTAYRFSKFLKRNRGAAIAASLVLLSLVTAVVGTTWGFFEAKHQEKLALEAAEEKELARQAEAKRAEGERLAKQDAEERRKEAETEKQIALAVREFLQDKLLSQADVDRQADALLELGRDSSEATPNPTILELLDRAAEELSAEKLELNFPNQPAVQAEILQTVGVTYRGIGEFDKAIEFLNRALILWNNNPQTDASKPPKTMSDLALSYRFNGEFDKAIDLFEQTLKLEQEVLGREHQQTLNTMNNLAAALHYGGRVEDAIPIFREAIELYESTLGANHSETLISKSSLASALINSGDFDKAAPLLEVVLPSLEESLGPAHPRSLNSMHALGQAYLRTGEIDKAIPLLERNKQLKQQTLRENHPSTINTIGDLAYAYLAAQQYDKAIPLSETTLKLKREHLGPDHPETMTAMNNLAMAYDSNGQSEKALPIYQDTRELLLESLGPAHPRTLGATSNLASAYQSLGQLDKALPLYEDSYEQMKSILGEKHPYTLIGLNNLAQAYHFGDKPESAVPLLLESVSRTSDPSRKHGKQAMLADNLIKLERYNEAEPVARACLAIREELLADHWAMYNSKILVARALMGQDKHSEAKPIALSGLEGMLARRESIPAAALANVTKAIECLVDIHEALAEDSELEARKVELQEWQDSLSESDSPEDD